MMFEAYVPTVIASRLEKSIDVSSLTADDHATKVFIGSKAGYLLSLSGVREGKRGYDLMMCRSFERKAVSALQIVSRHGIILCLSDSQLSAHDLAEPFTFKAAISDVKPITAFSSYVAEDDGMLYVAAAARRKIILYKWLLDEFSKVPLEISPAYFADNAQQVVWCGPNIAFAVQNEYHFSRVLPLSNSTVEVKKLFNAGSRTGDPIIVDLPDRQLIAYCRECFLFFQEYAGGASTVPKVKFSDFPIEIVYDSPYLLALLTKGRIEVRAVQPSTHIQTIQLNKAMRLSTGLPGTVYVGSSSDVWLLNSRPLMRANIERLVAEKQFELAIQLAEKCSEIGDKGVVEIKRKAAFNLFCQRKFEEWLEIHSQVKTDVITVIAHFPRLLDSSYRDSVKSLLDEPPPEFAENECRSGLLALSSYLAAVRTEHAKAISDYRKKAALGRSGDLLSLEEIKNHANILQVVDTTLLKCYLQTNEILVASLMRLPDNKCILADSEAILLEREKFYELYLLYEKRNLHDKALILLKQHAHDTDSPLSGCELTVQYLQRLGNSHLDLIFSFAAWVLHEDSQLGLTIFTLDDDIVRGLDRERVLQFLTRECVPVIIPYLEHIIYNWDEKRPKFHENLGSHYISKVKGLMKEYISSLKDDENIVRAGEEEGELGEYRRRLAHFLQSSISYSPEKLIVQLRYDSMFEERAMLLGRLKKHEQALAIYTRVLRDYRAAVKYCELHYNRNDPENSKVWLTLLRLYTHPPDPSVLGFMQGTFYHEEPNQAEALCVLKEHASCIDTVEAVSLLPSDYPLRSVWNALEAVLQAAHDKRTSTLMHRSLCDAALRQCSTRLAAAQSVKFSVGYSSECAICGKKISTSAFARHTDGRLEHFFCYQKNEAR